MTSMKQQQGITGVIIMYKCINIKGDTKAVKSALSWPSLNKIMIGSQCLIYGLS